jgi:RNA polymerase sigma-70 factor (ECF subfamily)
MLDVPVVSIFDPEPVVTCDQPHTYFIPAREYYYSSEGLFGMSRSALAFEPVVMRRPRGLLLQTRHAVGAFPRAIGGMPRLLEMQENVRAQQIGAHARSGAWVRVDDSRKAFAEVVLPHLSDAYGLARAITGNRADAEDVVQEACLRAFRAIATLSGSNHRAWVLTIVHHTACTWLAKNRPAALVIVNDLEEVDRTVAPASAHGSATPETALIAKSDNARLEAAIAALPLPFRETLVLRDIQDLDYREIARITDVPIGTVMSRLARARARLIATLGREAP